MPALALCPALPLPLLVSDCGLRRRCVLVLGNGLTARLCSRPAFQANDPFHDVGTAGKVADLIGYGERGLEMCACADAVT